MDPLQFRLAGVKRPSRTRARALHSGLPGRASLAIPGPPFRPAGASIPRVPGSGSSVPACWGERPSRTGPGTFFSTRGGTNY